jgi:uncharacterized protein YjiS (DUF1127 family)
MPRIGEPQAGVSVSGGARSPRTCSVFRPGLFGWLDCWSAPTLWARTLRDVMERRAASELYRLNDHLLRDIGLDRVCVRSGGIRAVSNALRLR